MDGKKDTRDQGSDPRVDKHQDCKHCDAPYPVDNDIDKK